MYVEIRLYWKKKLLVVSIQIYMLNTNFFLLKGKYKLCMVMG